MPNRLFLPGFPEGSIKIGASLSILSKEGRVTYFLGADNYFSHRSDDEPSRRFILATLMENGHVRPRDLEDAPLSIPHRTLMNWTAQLREKGSTSFFRPRERSNPRVMTEEKSDECGKLLNEGISIADVAKRAEVEESTLRKAIRRGAVKKKHEKLLPR